MILCGGLTCWQLLLSVETTHLRWSVTLQGFFFRKKKTAKKNFAVGCVLRVLGDWFGVHIIPIRALTERWITQMLLPAYRSAFLWPLSVSSKWQVRHDNNNHYFPPPSSIFSLPSLYYHLTCHLIFLTFSGNFKLKLYLTVRVYWIFLLATHGTVAPASLCARECIKWLWLFYLSLVMLRLHQRKSNVKASHYFYCC